MSQEDRSEALIGLLEALERSDIEFVLVGGYAISQFETRFSTDLDLVITPDDYDEVVKFLEAHDFERQVSLGGFLNRDPVRSNIVKGFVRGYDRILIGVRDVICVKGGEAILVHIICSLKENCLV